MPSQTRPRACAKGEQMTLHVLDLLNIVNQPPARIPVVRVVAEDPLVAVQDPGVDADDGAWRDGGVTDAQA